MQHFDLWVSGGEFSPGFRTQKRVERGPLAPFFKVLDLETWKRLGALESTPLSFWKSAVGALHFYAVAPLAF